MKRLSSAVAFIAAEHVEATTGVRSRQQAEERYQEYLKFLNE